MFPKTQQKVVPVSAQSLAPGPSSNGLEASAVGSGFSCWRGDYCDQGIFQLLLGMLYLDMINNRASLTIFKEIISFKERILFQTKKKKSK